MDWPSQSPESNFIEEVWDHLDREQGKKAETSKEELSMSFKKSGKLFLNIRNDRAASECMC